MSSEPIVHKEKPVASAINPFARQLEGHVNAGTIAVESERAIAEAQGKLVIAKRFPRDQARAYVNIIEACKRPGLAEEACYSFPRGGEVVSGPAIRLAEMLAANWGNVDYGIRELSRKEGVSEMEAYCWDLETNTMSSQKFTVRHIRDTRGGGRALTDERDIYELTANMGARRLRARILAILPADLVQAAVDQCSKTIANGGEVPMADRIRGMLAAFKVLGVPPALIEKRLGHSLDNLTGEELGDLRKIHNSLRDNMSKLGDWFGDGQKTDEDVPYDEPVQRPAAPPRAKKGAAAVVENAPAQTEAERRAAEKGVKIIEADFTEVPSAAAELAKQTEDTQLQADLAAREADLKATQPKERARLAEKLAAEARLNLAAEKQAADRTPADQKILDDLHAKQAAAIKAKQATAPRTEIKDGEELTVRCQIKDVMPTMTSRSGVAAPSVQALVEGEFTGRVNHYKGATGTDAANLKPLPVWQPGAWVTLKLLGKLNTIAKKITASVLEITPEAPAEMQTEEA